MIHYDIFFVLMFNFFMDFQDLFKSARFISCSHFQFTNEGGHGENVLILKNEIMRVQVK